MNHRIDGLMRFRRRWWPVFDDLLSSDVTPIDGYGVYGIWPKEQVGLIEEPVQDVSSRLRSLGFRREPVAALKIRAKTGEWSAGSWVIKGRKLAELIDVDEYNSEHDVEEMQLHITLFAMEDGTEVNAHYEYRWEPWTPHWDSERPWRHKKPSEYEGHYSPAEGVAMVTDLFDKEGVEYNHD